MPASFSNPGVRRRRWKVSTGMMMATTLCLTLATSQLQAEDAHAQAHTALEQGRADDALNLLRPLTSANPNDAEAQDLLCRVLLSEERPDDAVPSCEHAVSIEPSNAQYQLALAHASGSKAQHDSAVFALGIARRARDHFEAAARLSPNDWGILSDLGEYYAEAPSIAGGGLDKARRVVPQLMKLNPARGHWLTAKIAEAGKNFATAEAEYKAAIATGKNIPEGWVNLASFYFRRGRVSDAVDCIHKAEQADTEADPVLVDAANLLRQMDRENSTAIRMLRTYLVSKNRTEDAPAFAVHTTIGQILQQQGDNANATQEFSAALTLAHDYAPALKAMHSK